MPIKPRPFTFVCGECGLPIQALPALLLHEGLPFPSGY